MYSRRPRRGSCTPFAADLRVNDEAQLRRAARTANASGDHLARQHLTQVADVEFTAGRDAGVDQMVGTLFNEACPDDVGPVDHVFTSDGNGSDDAAEGTLSISFRMVLLTSRRPARVPPASRTASMVLDMVTPEDSTSSMMATRLPGTRPCLSDKAPCPGPPSMLRKMATSAPRFLAAPERRQCR